MANGWCECVSDLLWKGQVRRPRDPSAGQDLARRCSTGGDQDERSGRGAVFLGGRVVTRVSILSTATWRLSKLDEYKHRQTDHRRHHAVHHEHRDGRACWQDLQKISIVLRQLTAVAEVTAADPGPRLIDVASGWHQAPGGSILSSHSYYGASVPGIAASPPRTREATTRFRTAQSTSS